MIAKITTALACFAYILMAVCMGYQASQIFDMGSPAPVLGKNLSAPTPNLHFHSTPLFMSTNTLLLISLSVGVCCTFLALTLSDRDR